MVVVTLSKEEKIAYGMFSWLRKQLPNADVCTLRHISAYVAKTNNELDIDKDVKLIISMDGTMCNLLINDETEIRFENSSHRTLNFVVEKRDSDVFMILVVSTHKNNDLSTASVFGDVICGDWRYIIGFEDYENKICFIRTYYKNKFNESGTSYFKVSNNNNIELDSINGLSYLSEMMVKVDLLYNNARSVNNSKLTRRKCV